MGILRKRVERNYAVLYLAIVVGGLSFMVVPSFREPFVGMHESSSLLFSGYAKMHVTYGFKETKFAATRWDPINNELVPEYVYHPVLIHVLLAVAYKVFGFENWVGRLYAFLFALGSLVQIYSICRLLYDRTTGVLAFSFGSFCPMFVLFCKLIDFSVVTLFFILSAVKAYSENKLYGGKAMKICLPLGLAMLSGWPGFILTAVLSLDAFGSRGTTAPGHRNSLFLSLLTTGIVIGILFAIYVFWLVGVSKGLETLVEKFSERALQSNASDISQFSLFQWLLLMGIRGIIYFTPVLAAGGLAWLIRKGVTYGINGKIALADRIVVVLFLIGAIHVVVFNQAAWDQNYWLYYLVPFFAVTGARAVIWMARAVAGRLEEVVAFGVFIVFLGTSLPVVWYGRTVEKENVEFFGILKKANSEIGEDCERLITVSSRYYQSLVFEYYFGRNVANVRNLQELRYALSEKGGYSSVKVLYVLDQEDKEKGIREVGPWLESQYEGNVIAKNGKRFVALFTRERDGKTTMETNELWVKRPNEGEGFEPIVHQVTLRTRLKKLAGGVYRFILDFVGAPEI